MNFPELCRCLAHEKGFVDQFFAVEGETLERHKLPGVDTSVSRQDGLLDYDLERLRRLISTAKEFGQVAPLRMKLHYVVVARSLDTVFE